MSYNSNTIKSQDELNEGGRKSDVLLSTIEELERTKKDYEQLEKVASTFFWFIILLIICLLCSLLTY